MARDRYAIPDPLCRHVPTVRVSSHEDLSAAARTEEPMASTHCCDRPVCQEDASAWVRSITRLPTVYIVALAR